jgi:hypothetical protein
MCVNGKIRSVKTVPGMGEGDKGEFNYDIVDTL